MIMMRPQMGWLTSTRVTRRDGICAGKGQCWSRLEENCQSLNNLHFTLRRRYFVALFIRSDLLNNYIDLQIIISNGKLQNDRMMMWSGEALFCGYRLPKMNYITHPSTRDTILSSGRLHTRRVVNRIFPVQGLPHVLQFISFVFCPFADLFPFIHGPSERKII